jgi:hypothetical protein
MSLPQLQKFNHTLSSNLQGFRSSQSFQYPIAQLLDQIAFPKKERVQEPRPLQKALQKPGVSNLREAILSLSLLQRKILLSRISEDSVNRLISISQEVNSNMLWGRLDAFAEEQKNAGETGGSKVSRSSNPHV